MRAHYQHYHRMHHYNAASHTQVHAARLSPELLDLLGDNWKGGNDVVIKVQHGDVQKLMGADLRCGQ